MVIKSGHRGIKLLFLIYMFIFRLDFRAETRDLIGEITKLAKQEQALNKKLIKMTVFELAETQKTVAGNNEKYLLKDTWNNLWLFKPDGRRPVKNAEMVSNLGQLLGVGVPVLEELTLPINGREVFGSIQKIGFYNRLGNEKTFIKEMSSAEILSLQKLQVFDWLIVMRPGEMDEHCFISSKTGDGILAIDRDDGFVNPKHGRILKMEETDWKRSLYACFWDAYLAGEIDVNFKDVFELISYIQHLGDEEFKERLFFIEPEHKEEILEEILWRKANLKKEFKKFYHDLAEKRGELLVIFPNEDYKNYAANLIKKMQERISNKKTEYKSLTEKQGETQGNIEIISAIKIWEWICQWNEEWNELKTPQEIIEKAQAMKKNCSFIGEQLAIALYIRQLKTKQKLNIYRIIKHPKKLNPIRLEYNLRRNSYSVFFNNNDRKMTIFKKNGSILAHLRYIDSMKMENRNTELIAEYREKLNANSNKKTYLFLSAMSQAEYAFNGILNKLVITNTNKVKTFLKKLDDKFSWKYYGFALCYYGKGYIKKGIKKCEKVINLNNDKEAVYAAHMLLGVFYEHNSENIRFGKGFNIEKAIANYKKALKNNSNSIEAHLNLSNLYLIKELPKEALKKFKKVIKLDPQFAKEYLHLENIKGENTYENKEKYLDAIRDNTLSGEEHYILGLAYATKGRLGLAEKHFSKAREFGYEVDVKLN